VIDTVSEVETSNTTCNAEYVITVAAFRDSFKLSSKTLSLLWVTGKNLFMFATLVAI